MKSADSTAMGGATRMPRRLLSVLAGAAMLLGSGSVFAQADEFVATLTGGSAVPAVVSTGSGAFRATVSPDGTTVNYTLVILGTDSPVRFSHIHLGQSFANGGVAVFLCDSTGSGPAGTPSCPSPAGSVAGSFTAADVGAVDAQGLAAGDLEGLLNQMTAGATYVNVHTENIGSGEIRGQIQPAQ